MTTGVPPPSVAHACVLGTNNTGRRSAPPAGHSAYAPQAVVCVCMRVLAWGAAEMQWPGCDCASEV
eukprot:4646339-Prymnesium_polylepis.1